MNTNLSTLSAAHLRQLAELKDISDSVQEAMDHVIQGGKLRTWDFNNGGRQLIQPHEPRLTPKGKRIGRPPKRTMSAEARHKISLAAKRRWRAARRSGKTTL